MNPIVAGLVSGLAGLVAIAMMLYLANQINKGKKIQRWFYIVCPTVLMIVCGLIIGLFAPAKILRLLMPVTLGVTGALTAFAVSFYVYKKKETDKAE